MNQCQAITRTKRPEEDKRRKTHRQCSRKARQGSLYCGIHEKVEEPQRKKTYSRTQDGQIIIPLADKV